MSSDIYSIDATNQTLGRLATKAAVILIGKHKPTFQPYLDLGDRVKIININKIKISGKKLDNKIYYYHSNHPGGLKAKKMKEFSSAELFKKAVWNMLPKNKLRKIKFMKLEVE